MVEYPVSPISSAHLHQLRSETAKFRLTGTLQQVDICWLVIWILQHCCFIL